MRFIHQIPEQRSYRWSSWNEYFDVGYDICDTITVLKLMKRDKLKDFLLEKDDDFKCLTLIKKIKDTDAVAFICQVSGCKNLEEFRRLSVKEKLNSFPLFDLGELGI